MKAVLLKKKKEEGRRRKKDLNKIFFFCFVLLALRPLWNTFFMKLKLKLELKSTLNASMNEMQYCHRVESNVANVFDQKTIDDSASVCVYVTKVKLK